MWMKWLPWRFIVRNVARRQGFLDPITLVSRLQRFSQPSEVAAPTELLRSGAVLHARGLMNSQAIQHNLDWIWPYWVQRQFDPLDDALKAARGSFDRRHAVVCVEAGPGTREGEVRVRHQSRVDCADRIAAAHIKDIAPEGECVDEDGWADVGHGVMDWTAIMAALRKTDARWFVMEHDNPKDHSRFASRSIETARGL